MKNGRMQCKDIPDTPVLEFLGELARGEVLSTYSLFGQGPRTWAPSSATWGYPEAGHCVSRVMPEFTPPKLQLAKMRQLMHRGLVDGCACGCRGDFELTEKGWAAIGKERPRAAWEVEAEKRAEEKKNAALLSYAVRGALLSWNIQ